MPSIEEIKRRKALMRAAGLPVINDASWGSWQDGIWRQYSASQGLSPVKSASRPGTYITQKQAQGEIRPAPSTMQKLSQAAVLAIPATGTGTAVGGPIGGAVLGTAAGLYGLANAFGINEIKGGANSVKNWVMGIPSTVGRWFGVNKDEEKPAEEKPAESTQEEKPAASSETPNNKKPNKKQKPSKQEPNNQPKHAKLKKAAKTAGVVAGTTAVASPVLDAAFNLASMGMEDDNTKHEWIWPITKTRFAIEKGILKGYSTKADTTTNKATDKKVEQPDTVESRKTGTQLDSIPTNNTYGLVL